MRPRGRRALGGQQRGKRGARHQHSIPKTAPYWVERKVQAKNAGLMGSENNRDPFYSLLFDFAYYVTPSCREQWCSDSRSLGTRASSPTWRQQ